MKAVCEDLKEGKLEATQNLSCAVGEKEEFDNKETCLDTEARGKPMNLVSRKTANKLNGDIKFVFVKKRWMKDQSNYFTRCKNGKT